MHFTGEITLGNLVTVITLIGITISIGRRIGSFETTVSTHASKLDSIASRLNNFEERLFDLARGRASHPRQS